jgi:precorrin-6B methylase 1
MVASGAYVLARTGWEWQYMRMLVVIGNEANIEQRAAKENNEQ